MESQTAESRQSISVLETVQVVVACVHDRVKESVQLWHCSIGLFVVTRHRPFLLLILPSSTCLPSLSLPSLLGAGRLLRWGGFGLEVEAEGFEEVKCGFAYVWCGLEEVRCGFASV